MWPGREPEHSGGERFFFSYDILWRMGIAAAAATGAPPAGHSGGESIVLVMIFC